MNFKELLELEAQKGFDDINIIRNSDAHSFLDEWAVTDLLGRGSFGNVYRIVKPQQGVSAQECALKVCEFYDHSDGERICREIETQKLLHGHPNAVQIEDYDMILRTPPRQSYLLIRMELLRPLPADGLSERDTVRMGLDICSVLEKCASLEPKVVHCDIKPANILMSKDGHFKLGDFGTAKTLDASLTYSGNRGTPLYMAPEVATYAGYNSRCDIFSLGYTMLTMLNGGHHPYEDAGEPSAILYKMYESRTRPTLRGVSAALQRILRRMCEPDLRQRYSSAVEVKKVLESFVRRKENSKHFARPKTERQIELAQQKEKAWHETNIKAAENALIRAEHKAIAARTLAEQASAEQKTRAERRASRLEARAEQMRTVRKYVNGGAAYHDALRQVRGKKAHSRRRRWISTFNKFALAIRRPRNAIILASAVALTVAAAVILTPRIPPENITTPDGFTLTLSDDGKEYRLTGHTGDSVSETITRITLPSKYKGLPVSEIDDRTPYTSSAMTEFVIPDSVTCIANLSFENCSALAEVNIPDNVAAIENISMENCLSLRSFNVPSDLSLIRNLSVTNCPSILRIVIPSSNEINALHFDGCTSLEEVSLPNAPALRRFSFSDCTSLVGFDIPEGTTSINTNAFLGCSSLNEINIPDSVSDISECAFKGCMALKSIEIPYNVTSIGEYAFSDCTSLESIEIPDSVTYIGEYAFYNCKFLKSIEIPDGVTFIRESTFMQCSSLEHIGIPDSVTYFGKSAFLGCKSLERIEIPDSVTSIGESAFKNCTALENIDIPDSVTSIGESAFESCTALENIDIPDSVTSIGESAFKNCTALENIDIPDSVTSIGESAFKNCTALENIDIPDSVTSIGESAFENCTALENIDIPDSVTSIGYKAFSDCSSLESIRIPDSITFIVRDLFRNCTSLKSIYIPDSVTYIGDYAFRNCRSLESISIPESINLMGIGPFSDCTSLKSIYIPDSMTYIPKDVFSGIYNPTVYAPHPMEYYGLFDYKANWIIRE